MFKSSFRNYYPKDIFLRIIRYIGLFIIFFFLFVSIFSPLMTKHNLVGGYKFSNYDLQLRGCSESFLQKEETKKHIEIGAYGNLFNLAIQQNNISVQGRALSIRDKNLNNIFSLISKTLFIDYDKKLINKADSIFLSYQIARELNVAVGDKVNIYGDDDDYKVAGILEACVVPAFNNCAIFFIENDKYSSQEELYYTTSFVKVRNFKKGLEYFENNYMHFKSLYLEYGDKWEIIASPLAIEKSRIYSFTSRIKLLQEAKDEYAKTYSTYEDIAILVLSLSALFTTNVYTYYKDAQINKAKYAILRTSGLTKGKIFYRYMSSSFLEQTIILIFSLVFIRWVPLAGDYISFALVLSWIGVFLAIITSVSIVAGFVALYTVRDKELLNAV